MCKTAARIADTFFSRRVRNKRKNGRGSLMVCIHSPAILHALRPGKTGGGEAGSRQGFTFTVLRERKKWRPVGVSNFACTGTWNQNCTFLNYVLLWCCSRVLGLEIACDAFGDNCEHTSMCIYYTASRRLTSHGVVHLPKAAVHHVVRRRNQHQLLVAKRPRLRKEIPRQSWGRQGCVLRARREGWGRPSRNHSLLCSAVKPKKTKKRAPSSVYAAPVLDYSIHASPFCAYLVTEETSCARTPAPTIPDGFQRGGRKKKVKK